MFPYKRKKNYKFLTHNNSEYPEGGTEFSIWIGKVIDRCIPTLHIDILLGVNIQEGSSPYNSLQPNFSRNTYCIVLQLQLLEKGLNERFNFFPLLAQPKEAEQRFPSLSQ